MLRALWGYVGDKLNIAVKQLSRENISQQLEARQVSADTIQQFIGAIDECEFARYAPGDAQGNMNKVYDAAMNAITQIAGTMKKGRAPKPATALLLLLLLPLTASAVTKAEADSAYAQGHYQQAARDYETLLQQGVSTAIYYNLGNAYYRMDDMPHAVLNYERALLLSPGDADVRFNLQMARSKTVDKITPESEMFFVTWYHMLVNFTSVDGWARMALCALAVAIFLALLYLFASPVWMRKAGFFGALAMLLLFVVANIFAYAQKQGFVRRSGAIIMAPAVTVKSTPAKQGTDLFILHEGTRVEITDGTMRQWKRIRLADGKEGWIETSQMEII